MVVGTLALVGIGVAQTVTGALECRVTDPTGAMIAGADVSVKNEETGLERATKTSQPSRSDAAARMLQLPLRFVF